MIFQSSIGASGVVPFKLGGHIALDFVNTVTSWTKPDPKEYLTSFEQLIFWSVQAGLIAPASVKSLLATPSAIAHEEHARAIIFRARLERIFDAVIKGQMLDDHDLEALNELLRQARLQQVFSASDGSFSWAFSAAPQPETPLMAIALAAAELLESGDLRRLKRCPSPDGCGWLFLDESRNRSRRWCSMDQCGASAKARRFAARHPRWQAG